MENNNYENVLEDGNVLTCITHNKVIEVSTYAQKANVIGILQRVLAIISLAGMAIVILLNLAAIMRCIKSGALTWRNLISSQAEDISLLPSLSSAELSLSYLS